MVAERMLIRVVVGPVPRWLWSKYEFDSLRCTAVDCFCYCVQVRFQKANAMVARKAAGGGMIRRPAAGGVLRGEGILLQSCFLSHDIII